MKNTDNLSPVFPTTQQQKREFLKTLSCHSSTKPAESQGKSRVKNPLTFGPELLREYEGRSRVELALARAVVRRTELAPCIRVETDRRKERCDARGLDLSQRAGRDDLDGVVRHSDQPESEPKHFGHLGRCRVDHRDLALVVRTRRRLGDRLALAAPDCTARGENVGPDTVPAALGSVGANAHLADLAVRVAAIVETGRRGLAPLAGRYHLLARRRNANRAGLRRRTKREDLGLVFHDGLLAFEDLSHHRLVRGQFVGDTRNRLRFGFGERLADCRVGVAGGREGLRDLVGVALLVHVGYPLGLVRPASLTRRPGCTVPPFRHNGQ